MAAIAELDSESLSSVVEETPWKIVWKRFKKHKLALAGIVVIGLILLACLLAPWIAPHDPIKQNRDANNQIIRNGPISAEYWMGTDNIGRDIFSRLLYAGRMAPAGLTAIGRSPQPYP